MSDWLKNIQLRMEQIDKKLAEIVPTTSLPYAPLFEAARYSLLSGGKRLRPVLTLITSEIFGASLETAIIPACSLELIHTYSMIHDDLPCMDDDDFRRGKPTLHRMFPEGHAVLTGDFLLTYAFEILADSPNLSAQKKLTLVKILAQRSGAMGMIGGQVLDLAAENKHITLEQLKQIHAHKSGALISAAVEFGGIIGDASVDHMHQLKIFGEHIGLAFQIVDDILDVTSSHLKHGRSVASDAINQKSTYVSLMGVDAAKKCADDHYALAVHALESLNIDTSLLQGLAKYMIERRR